MISKHLSEIASAVAPAVGNHLWQSTLFVVVCGFLTLVLRTNHARARYGVWLAASVKFLIPFSLLVGIGSHLRWSNGPAGSQARLYVAMEQVSQPFTQPTMPVFFRSSPPTVSQSLIHLLLPGLLAAAWLCGFLAVLFVWCMRWRRISAAIREAAPLREGREVEALRQLERIGGIQRQIEMLSSSAPLEPGIFGIARPVLVWPARISERLEDPHLEAILAHELWHVRRRDNLTAAIHMMVEAIFWFHPVVWWLGARLAEERECACDEQVLESGSERRIYAESILKTCEFCVASPLACVSGVTGADLKKRIVRIMTKIVPRRLDFPKKALLSATGLLAIAVPVLSGVLHAMQSRPDSAAPTPSPLGTQSAVSPVAHATTHDWQVRAGGKQSFDVASVKQNKSGGEFSNMNVPIGPGDVYPRNGGLFSGTNVPLISYIYFAYKLSGSELQLLLPHLPNWVVRDRFDIQARADGNPTKDQMRLMMQSLLEDRFKLVIHYETQQLPVFALVLSKPGKTGPQIQPHSDDPPCPTAPPPTPSGLEAAPPPTVAGGFPAVCGGIDGMPSSTPGRMCVGARNVPIELLAATLPQIGNLDRAVLDRTGLSGTFDFTFEWTPQRSGATPPGADIQMEESGPTFAEDMRKQLGLRLEPQKGSVQVLVIKHVEKPSEN
jgi:bla regulator protein blaR1